MSLRLRITLAFIAIIIVTVGGSTIAHFQTVSKQLENNLKAQVYRSSLVVEQQVRRESNQLKRKLYNILSNSQFQNMLFSFAQNNQGFSQLALLRKTAEREDIDILKLINSKGEVVFSTHWPASFGAKDPMHEHYQNNVSEQQLILEETPQKSMPSFEIWRNLKSYEQQYTLVIGFFIDRKVLSNFEKLASADALSLCPKKVISEHTSLLEKLKINKNKKIQTVRFKNDFQWKKCRNSFQVGDSIDTDEDLNQLHFTNPSIENQSYMYSALDIQASKDYVFISAKSKKEISLMRSNILRREFWIGFISILIALIFALMLERRLTRPIEKIAETVHEIADGNFETVEQQIAPTSTPEFQQLMQDINTMANKIRHSKIELRKVERVAAWREIARGLAHEVKNPLTPILGAMSVIKRAYELKREDFNEILIEQSDAVIEEVQRLKELSDAFANFARLPAPQITNLNILPLIQSILKLYVNEDVKVEIINDFPLSNSSQIEQSDQSIVIQADKNQIRTILTNLIKNALEAMENIERPEKKIRIHIQKQKNVMENESDFLKISIQDNGSGLSAEVIEQLFTPYFSTKGSRGTGLGLALCHRIVSEHKGTIHGEIVPNSDLNGARFVICLPL